MFNDSDNTKPFAYLNYLVFDKNMVLVQQNWIRVTEAAGFWPNEIGDPAKKPVQLTFSAPVVPTVDGYIYVWVSNSSENTKVWFDDLKVKHVQSVVAQATDYGAWGEVLREQKTNSLDQYRYGYQGQFAEKDDEMGWSSFELRMFDPIIARWLIPDPYKQYWSPYMAMGNNPINLIDPDGGMDGDPNPFGKGDNYVPDQGGGRSYYATVLDEVVIFAPREFNTDLKPTPIDAVQFVLNKNHISEELNAFLNRKRGLNVTSKDGKVEFKNDGIAENGGDLGPLQDSRLLDFKLSDFIDALTSIFSEPHKQVHNPSPTVNNDSTVTKVKVMQNINGNKLSTPYYRVINETYNKKTGEKIRADSSVVRF